MPLAPDLLSPARPPTLPSSRPLRRAAERSVDSSAGVAAALAPAPCDGQGHAVIVGFGVPGRAAAEAFDRAGVGFCVVELNALTVTRCARGGVPIIEGDAADPAVLARANVAGAGHVVVALPNDPATIAVVREVRRVNPTARLTVRVAFTSNGMKARSLGADEVIVAEQVVAAEITRALADLGTDEDRR